MIIVYGVDGVIKTGEQQDITPEEEFAHCVVNRSAVWTQTSSGSSQVVPWTVDNSDPDDMHDTGANTERITIPSGGDGVYLVGAELAWNNSSTGVRVITIQHLNSGGTTQKSYGRHEDCPQNMDYGQTVCGLFSAVSGDYFRVIAYQDTGGNFQGIDDSAAANFWAVRIA